MSRHKERIVKNSICVGKPNTQMKKQCWNCHSEMLLPCKSFFFFFFGSKVKFPDKRYTHMVDSTKMISCSPYKTTIILDYIYSPLTGHLFPTFYIRHNILWTIRFRIYLFLFFKSHFMLFVCVCVLWGRGTEMERESDKQREKQKQRECTPAKGRKGHHIPCSWSYWCSWATICRSRDLNSSPPKEQELF